MPEDPPNGLPNTAGCTTLGIRRSPVKQSMAIFENILGTVGNTPVVRINRLAPKGVDLYVKVEAFNPLGSVKDRLALGIIGDAERTGALKPGQTVIEAKRGNTGIGLAMVCAAKGYPLVLTMAESFSIERRRLMRFLGAKVVLTPSPEGATGMVRRTVELAGDAVDAGLVDEVITVSGPDAMKWARELAQKEGIFVGTSSGATFAAALQVAKEAEKGASILAMLPDTGERYLSTPLFADISV